MKTQLKALFTVVALIEFLASCTNTGYSGSSSRGGHGGHSHFHELSGE